MDSIARNQLTAADIRRLEDGPQNPLTDKPWPSNHQEILNTRRRLPVYGKYEEILGVYHQSQVMILSSDTGSGKSTQVPQLLVYDEWASGLQVACTQPRRLAARELADRVADEMGVIYGEEVGSHVRFEPKTGKKTRLVYMTEGILLRKAIGTDKNLKDFACVIIDEAHERTANTDLLLALLKGIVARRQDFRVIIMSATIDADEFKRYFNDCPLLHVPGRSYDVEQHYLELGNEQPDCIVSCARSAAQIHHEDGPGDILIFMPGEDEIAGVCEILRLNTTNLTVFPLHSSLPQAMQKQALEECQTRKCIVATNIAETSLTIDGIVYVIDSGLSRQEVYNPRLQMHMLQVRTISQASARQRAGRAGRTQKGVCFRVYTQAAFDNFIPSTRPGILCQQLESTILTLAAAGHSKVMDFDWISPPHPESVSRAAYNLHKWEFLSVDGALTPSGIHAAKCPLDPMWYRALVVATAHGCTMDILDLASISSVQGSIFTRPKKFQQVADIRKNKWAHPSSDHLALLNAFHAFENAWEERNNPGVDLDKWCFDNFLNRRVLEEVAQIRKDLIGFLRLVKMKPTRASITNSVSIRKTLAIAFCTHLAILFKNDEYRTVPGNSPGLLEPTSGLNGRGSQWIVFSTYRLSGVKPYFQPATAIDPEWLVEQHIFKTEDLPKKGDGTFRQQWAKESLDKAGARAQAD
ncbi:hypothetical protein PV08_02388 [Exophiala spinifera]|uniref:Pre-mRNA-splicing factor ATP-dependent RNA helicase PRP43 n=1 Tax=Exophiala spinifera TaxID=91928 RepID=A0A0D1YS91_9EURO|nr:uncharacterized protein PV08_02388 [Exophiala spinifera]KIW18101.1 hypothetical protein PV08_02388 [Exophiala spinifera]